MEKKYNSTNIERVTFFSMRQKRLWVKRTAFINANESSFITFLCVGVSSFKHKRSLLLFIYLFFPVIRFCSRYTSTYLFIYVMYVYICVCMYTYTYIYIYMHVSTCICLVSAAVRRQAANRSVASLCQPHI